MKLRTVIFWPHLVAGVVAGAVVLIMSVTGVLLTYERQMIAWSDSHLRSVPPVAGATRLQVDALLDAIRISHPDVAPTAITIGSAPDAAVVLTVPGRTLRVDAYSGRLLGEGSTGMRRFMSETRAWHRWLGVEGEGRPAARAITGWSNLLFLFLVCSGIYLWFPRRWTWQYVRNVVVFRGGLRGKARDFNWHNVIGMWSAVPLFIVVLCAVPISFRWASDAVYLAVGENPPAQNGRGAAAGARGEPERQGRTATSRAGLNALWARAEQHVPGWRTINLRMPESGQAPVVFAIDRGDGGQPHLRSTLTLNRESGDVVSDERFSSLTLGRRIRNLMRFAHTGEVLGIPGQTIAGLVSAGSLVMVWTGVALSLRRFVAWIRRRREPRSIPVAERENAA